ncbi:MAG: MFS transporter, partial [Anaerolinea sp.]|nr:MFS transporter [Anaerolinea sp.]
LAVVGMVGWPTAVGFYSMNVVMGLAQSLGGVTFGPFLMENSGEKERTYLFSFSMGLQMIAGFAGNWLGGSLPTWTGGLVGAAPTSAAAYGWALTAVAILSFFALLPILFMHNPRKTAGDEARQSVSPFQYARQNPALLLKLISPMLITSLGAGLLMPFLNIFFRHAFASSDKTIGALFAVGSLFMGIGLLAAPPLADRFGKIKVVVLTQALSIPFLALMGFVPLFGVSAAAYLVRLALMNMSNPVYQAFVMEQVDEEARATVASLVSMSWNVGWAFSPTLSGWLQVHYGFNPVFWGTILTYVVAIYLYWRFFGRGVATAVQPGPITP